MIYCTTVSRDLCNMNNFQRHVYRGLFFFVQLAGIRFFCETSQRIYTNGKTSCLNLCIIAISLLFVFELVWWSLTCMTLTLVSKDPDIMMTCFCPTFVTFPVLLPLDGLQSGHNSALSPFHLLYHHLSANSLLLSSFRPFCFWFL